MNNIKKLVIIVLSSIFLLAIVSSIVLMSREVYAQSEEAAISERNFADDSVLVVLDEEISGVNKEHDKAFFDGVEIAAIKDLTKRTNAKAETEGFQQILQLYLEEPSKENVLLAVEKLQAIDGVYSAEPNYIYEVSKSANDTYYANGTQWNLNGENGINISDAWDITTGSSTVRVGIIDSGIAAHPDLNANLGTGWDFINDNAITTDDINGHGTHVAGIIGAVGNNGSGIAGLNWDVTLIPLQASNDLGICLENYIVQALTWATDRWGTSQQIDILNFSAEGWGITSAVNAALGRYPGLFVWAAGNMNEDVDSRPDVEDFERPNLISVGALDEYGDRADDWEGGLGSNYSSSGKHIDIYAPGDNVYTTKPANGYENSDGTSISAPHVAGVAALMLAAYPELSTTELKSAILDSADTITISIPGGTQQVKKLNAGEAVDYVANNGEFSDLFAGGNGTPNYPYLISNATQLNNLRYAHTYVPDPNAPGGTYEISGYFRLTNNITVSGDWQPIEHTFTGLFDGDNHSITYSIALLQEDMELEALPKVGLFGSIGEVGRVQDLTLSNCKIINGAEVDGIKVPLQLVGGSAAVATLGILAGVVNKGYIISVSVINPTIDCDISFAYVGGICGAMYGNSVTDCVVSGGTLTNYNGALGGMAGYGDIVYFSGGSCSTTLTKENYEDTDQIGEVVGNSTSTSTVSCSVTINRNGKCISEGTLITLADGTQVPVEELDGDELLLVWDFERGQFGAAPIVFIDSDPERAYRVIELTFSDGTKVEVISEHGFWDRTLNKYVYLDENAAQYIGHWFDKRAADAEGDFSGGYVQLTAVTVTEKVTVAYSPVTQGHLCYFVNGMLSMPGGIEGIFNIFEVDPETMAYDAEAFAEDIEEYGLYTYEEFAQEYPISEEAFEAFGCKYFKVALGKGVVTEARLVQLMNRYAEYLL